MVAINEPWHKLRLGWTWKPPALIRLHSVGWEGGCGQEVCPQGFDLAICWVLMMIKQREATQPPTHMNRQCDTLSVGLYMYTDSLIHPDRVTVYFTHLTTAGHQQETLKPWARSRSPKPHTNNRISSWCLIPTQKDINCSCCMEVVNT